MMKKVFAFLILCMALALARVFLMVLAVALLLALVHAFLTRPRETLLFIVTLALSSVAVAQPLAFVVASAVVVVALVLSKRKLRTARGRHLRRLR